MASLSAADDPKGALKCEVEDPELQLQIDKDLILLEESQALFEEAQQLLGSDPKGTRGAEAPKGTGKRKAEDPKVEDPQGTGGTEEARRWRHWQHWQHSQKSQEESQWCHLTEAFFDKSQQLFNSDPKAQDPKGTCPAEDPKGTAKCNAEDPKAEGSQSTSSTQPFITKRQIKKNRETFQALWKAHRASGSEAPLKVPSHLMQGMVNGDGIKFCTCLNGQCQCE